MFASLTTEMEYSALRLTPPGRPYTLIGSHAEFEIKATTGIPFYDIFSLFGFHQILCTSFILSIYIVYNLVLLSDAYIL